MVAEAASRAQASPNARQLLAWYDRHRRDLPWRARPGETADPYRVWLSEIMLQQTTVAAVKPYFEAFTRRWPRIGDLAASPVDEVMKMWAGLGYYSRARNLYACATIVTERFGGRFPASEKALLDLPGIGAYTAAAITSIAFDQRAVVVDGNVERVMSRLFCVDEPLPQSKPEIRQRADELTPNSRTGDFAQAMMDLGATVCTPRNPACGICPFLGSCAAQATGEPERWPRKLPKGEKPTRLGTAFVVLRSDGALLVRTRPPKGLLGGMTETPTTEWTVTGPTALDAESAPIPAQWRDCGIVRHVFTHFPLELAVQRADVPSRTPAPQGMRWISANEIPGEAFPTLFRKVLTAAGIGDR